MKLTYSQSIEECRKDLGKRHQQDLHKLANHLQIPITDTIDHDIAIALIDQHYPSRKGTMDPASELPYGGDMQKAMQAQDRDAIRQIMAHRQSQEAERNRRLMEEQESRKLSESSKECSNDADLISLEDWSETNEPNLKIRYMSFTDPFEEIERIVCYDSEELKRWVDYPANTFAAWIPNRKNVFDKPNDDGMGPPGSGYGPSRSQKYVKLPDGNFVQFYNPDEITTQTQLIAVPYAKKRVGNIRGTYGVSELHGQAPDKTIYFVFPPNHDLEEGIRSLLKEDYEARFPLAGFAVDRENDVEFQQLLINFFKDNIPKEMTIKLKELYPYETNTHKLIDDLIPKLWSSIGHNDLLDQNVVNKDMITAYLILYKLITRQKIMDYWLNDVANPYIDKLEPTQALSILQGIHDTVPQENNDYDTNMDRVQEILPQTSPSSEPSPVLLDVESDQERSDLDIFEDRYRLSIADFVLAVENNSPNVSDKKDKLELDRREYYTQIAIVNTDVSNIVSTMNLEQTQNLLANEKTKLTEASEIRDEFIGKLLDGNSDSDPQRLYTLEKNHEKIWTTIHMLYKHINDLQEQQDTARQLDFGDDNAEQRDTARQLDFGDDNAEQRDTARQLDFGNDENDIRDLENKYKDALNKLVEHLRANPENTFSASGLLIDFEQISNDYYYQLSRSTEIPYSISLMDLDTVKSEIIKVEKEMEENNAISHEIYENIRYDTDLDINDIDKIIDLETKDLHLFKTLIALKERKRRLEDDDESDDSQATIVFEPVEPMDLDDLDDTRESSFGDNDSFFDPDEM